MTRALPHVDTREVTDRIRLWLPDADLVDRFGDRIGAETLAVSVETGDLRLEKS